MIVDGREEVYILGRKGMGGKSALDFATCVVLLSGNRPLEGLRAVRRCRRLEEAAQDGARAQFVSWHGVPGLV